MSREIEVEIKGDWSLQRDPSLYMNCCICGDRATRALELGEVRDHYSSAEYDVCGRTDCRDRSLQKFEEHLVYIHNHRKELAEQERWDHREGK